jgi:hypothetical protein
MFSKKKGASLLGCLGQEGGQALLIILLLLLLGSLTLPPILDHIGTALKSGQVYQPRTDEKYAADAGIEDGIWRIKYDCLNVQSQNYSPYDFDAVWSYDLDGPVNGLTVNETIQNIWIPSNVGPPAGTPAEIKAAIESNKLMVVGMPNAFASSVYKIAIDFYPDEGEEDALKVESIGVWLPYGFTYSGNCTLTNNITAPYYPNSTAISNYCGGQAVVWDYTSANFTIFPPGDGAYQTAEITFNYAADVTDKPAAIAWVETSGVSDVLAVTWDIDTRVFKITSSAGSTEVEAYSSKCELRQLGAAIAGDYKAIGNSLMSGGNPRVTWYSSSNMTLTGIDSDAQVIDAYLYWSAWRSEDSKQYPLPLAYNQTADPCSDFDNWDKAATSRWDIKSSHFRGRYVSGGDRYLTLKFGLNLSPYAGASTNVSWSQWRNGTLLAGDFLYFNFSADGGNTWSANITAFSSSNLTTSATTFSYPIPSQYLTNNFRMRFYLAGFNSGTYCCYLDDIQIASNVSAMPPDTSIIFKIDGTQVYFDADSQPKQGAQAITADRWQVLPNYNSDHTPNGFSYSCYKNVTSLLQAFCQKPPNPATNRPGNGDYLVADVLGNTGNSWSYAGWSLIIIYSSAETAGHQLYLYDNFIYADEDTDIDFDNDGSPGGTISGFIVPNQIPGEVNAATLTCFVGEGDDAYSGDFLAFNAPESYRSNPQDIPDEPYKLWDGTTPKDINDVWNSKSLGPDGVGVTADGVDIDTFYVRWDSGLLQPGNTSARIDMPTTTDSWNLVYIILSFRSKAVIGGTSFYTFH